MGRDRDFWRNKIRYPASARTSLRPGWRLASPPQTSRLRQIYKNTRNFESCFRSTRGTQEISNLQVELKNYKTKKKSVCNFMVRCTSLNRESGRRHPWRARSGRVAAAEELHHTPSRRSAVGNGQVGLPLSPPWQSPATSSGRGWGATLRYQLAARARGHGSPTGRGGSCSCSISWGCAWEGPCASQAWIHGRAWRSSWWSDGLRSTSHVEVQHVQNNC